MKLAWTVESPASDGSKTQWSKSCGSNGVAMRSSSQGNDRDDDYEWDDGNEGDYYVQFVPWRKVPRKARARRERIRERASRIAASLLPTFGLLVAVAATYAVVHVLAARRRRREHVAATEFKAKVAPYLVEAPEL